MKSSSIGLPEYSADPMVRRRVGRMLANFDAKFAPHAKRKSVVNSTQIHSQISHSLRVGCDHESPNFRRLNPTTSIGIHSTS